MDGWGIQYVRSMRSVVCPSLRPPSECPLSVRTKFERPFLAEICAAAGLSIVNVNVNDVDVDVDDGVDGVEKGREGPEQGFLVVTSYCCRTIQ